MLHVPLSHSLRFSFRSWKFCMLKDPFSLPQAQFQHDTDFKRSLRNVTVLESFLFLPFFLGLRTRCVQQQQRWGLGWRKKWSRKIRREWLGTRSGAEGEIIWENWFWFKKMFHDLKRKTSNFYKKLSFWQKEILFFRKFNRIFVYLTENSLNLQNN